MAPDGWESYSIKSTPCPCFTQSPSCSLFSYHGTYANKTPNGSDHYHYHYHYRYYHDVVDTTIDRSKW